MGGHQKATGQMPWTQKEERIGASNVSYHNGYLLITLFSKLIGVKVFFLSSLLVYQPKSSR